MIDIIFRHIKSCRTDHILLTLIRNGYGVKGVISHREKGMVVIMIRIALCDDDVAVLNEIKGLLNRYRETYHQEMVLEEFQSSLELLSVCIVNRAANTIFHTFMQSIPVWKL